MTIHQDDFFASPRQPGGRRATDDIGHMLERLTGQIQSRIVEVEQRHAHALHEMQGKLERMAGTAGRARPQMPSELAAAFSRIEAGMTDLVDRISETVPERRPSQDFVFGAAKPEHKHFVFDPPKREPVAPVSFDPHALSSDPWDAKSAEALVRLYESGEAALARHLPEAALFAGERSPSRAPAPAATPSLRAPAVSEPAPDVRVAPPAQVVVAGLGDDRTWLDSKLTAIAAEVTQSIGAAQSDGALKTLMSRVDQFEQRFSAALDGLARKSDVAEIRQSVVKQIETQIAELAGAIEQTHLQLGRLDAIEQQLADLTAFAHASMDAEPTADAASPAAPAHDFEHLADIAVERAISRLQATDTAAAAGTATGSPEHAARVDAVHALLEEFAAERRRGDEYTTGMLETVQEALIRLIDRVDAIDAASPRAAAAALAHEPAHPAEEPAVIQSRPVEALQAIPPAPVLPTAAAVSAGPLAPPVEPALATAPRRRVRVTAASPDAPPPAELDATEAELLAQPEISIKDIKIGPKGVRAMVTPAAGANLPEPEAADEQPAAKPARTARKTEPKVPGSVGKRSLYVAAAALSLIGIGFMAQNLLTRDSGALLVAPVAAPASGSAQPKSTAPAAQPNVAPTTPPGMMPAPPKADGQRSGALRRPDATGTDTAGTQRGPAMTTPETVSDDLSQNDTDDTDAAASLSLPRAVAAAPPSTTSSNAGVPGMALAGSMPTTGQQLMELNGLQRQANQAMASERIGFNARPASDFSNRFGSPAAPAAPAAQAAPVAANAAAIVTGSTTASEAAGEHADMPPALVGPVSLRLAAAKGDASASFEVATRFAEGRGIKQDFKQALFWYQRAANKGLAIAQYRLGTLYERGLGTPADTAKAKSWYKRSADQGNVKAMHNMAVLSAGNGQSAPDYQSASKWFKEAADRGLADSQFNLGVLYENGLGVDKDARQAYVWFALASRGGDQEATRRRDQIMSTMDAATLADANETLQKWRARVADPKINDPRVAGDQWRAAAAAGQDQPAPAPQGTVAANQTGGPRTIKVPVAQH